MKTYISRPDPKCPTGKAISQWAPFKDSNDPVAYAADVTKQTGLTVSTSIRSLTNDQARSVVEAIQSHEGWNVGSILYIPPP